MLVDFLRGHPGGGCDPGLRFVVAAAPPVRAGVAPPKVDPHVGFDADRVSSPAASTTHYGFLPRGPRGHLVDQPASGFLRTASRR